MRFAELNNVSYIAACVCIQCAQSSLRLADELGMRLCRDCPSGKYTSTIGVMIVHTVCAEQCTAHVNTCCAGSSICLPCSQGHYRGATDAADTCIACPLGMRVVSLCSRAEFGGFRLPCTASGYCQLFSLRSWVLDKQYRSCIVRHCSSRLIT